MKCFGYVFTQPEKPSLIVAQPSVKRKRRFEDVPSGNEFAPREKKQDRLEEKAQLKEQVLSALENEPQVINHFSPFCFQDVYLLNLLTE